jgi:hypothetical protein
VRWNAYNPYTGTYGRGAARYGLRGTAFARQAYNPYTKTYAARAGASTRYRSWGSSVVVRGDRWARGGHASGPRGAIVAAGDSWGRRGFAAKNRHGDVYVGRNGNVYKRSGSGDWSEYHKNKWRGTQRQNLNREFRSRSNGNRSASRYNRASRGRGSRGGGRR